MKNPRVCYQPPPPIDAEEECDCPTFRDAMTKGKQALSASGQLPQVPRRHGTSKRLDMVAKTHIK
jgi:hypothetical protein